MITIKPLTSAPAAQRRKAFASAATAATTWRAGAYGLASQVNAALQGLPCHLAVLFVSGTHKDLDPEDLSFLVGDLLQCRTLVACSAWGVISTGREVETESAMGLLAMHLPDAQILPFSISKEQGSTLRKPSDLYGLLDVYPSDKPGFLLFADPQDLNTEKLVRLFNAAYPGRPMAGGLVSAAILSRENWMTLGGRAMDGAVGVALSGGVELKVLLSPGTRPIGKRLVVTRSSGRTLYELDGKPALDALTEALTELPPMSRELSHQALFLGFEVDGRRMPVKGGLYLSRNLLGFDMAHGTLRLASPLRPGRRVRFHLADPAFAERELKVGLRHLMSPPSRPRGGLLFSSCGRGRFLYGEPDHDVRMVASSLGEFPMAGFFAAGEIAPVSGVNYVHGVSSVLALIG